MAKSMAKVIEHDGKEYKSLGTEESLSIWKDITFISESAVDNLGIDSISFYLSESEESISLLAFAEKLTTYENHIFPKLFNAGEIVYQKDTKTISSDSLTPFIDSISEIHEMNNMYILKSFVAYVLHDAFPYCYNALNEIGIKSSEYTHGSRGRFLEIKNILHAFLYHSSELEKIAKISPKILSEGFCAKPWDEIINIKTSLPGKLLQWANKQIGAQEILNILTTIYEREDGNNAVIFQNYVSGLVKAKLAKDNWSYNINAFYNSLLAIYILDDKYRIKPLLEYLIRQSFYYGNFEGQTNEAQLLKDYITMARGQNLYYERYPADLMKAHNCMMRNAKSLNLSPEIESKFIEAVKNHKKYEVSVGDYIVVVPKTPKDLVNEGNALNHCVGNYVSRIACGETIIAFLREAKSPETSFVTIEIKENEIIQAKKSFNEDVLPETEKVLKDVERKWKKAC